MGNEDEHDDGDDERGPGGRDEDRGEDHDGEDERGERGGGHDAAPAEGSTSTRTR